MTRYGQSLKMGRAMNHTQTPLEAPLGLVDLRSQYVIVIDDDILVGDVIEGMLSSIGLQVLSAQNHDGALNLIMRFGSATACAIIDYSMPDMHITQLLERIRRIQPEIKVILSSGYPSEEVFADVSEDDFDGFLAKPFLPDRLIAELQRLFLEPPTIASKTA